MYVLKAMGLQPVCNLLDIAVRWAELLPELFGSQPLTVARRRFVLLIVKKFLQGIFLLSAAFKDEQHALQAEVKWRGAAVEFWAG